MDYSFNNDDIDTIRKSYIFKDLKEPRKINDEMRIEFENRIECYKIPEKLFELKKRINASKMENDEKMKVDEETINKLINEYNNIIKEAREEHLYYWNALSSFKYKEYKIPKDLYIKATQELLDARLKSVINREKLIILLNDKVKLLFDP